jgi:hypothetical protein
MEVNHSVVGTSQGRFAQTFACVCRTSVFMCRFHTVWLGCEQALKSCTRAGGKQSSTVHDPAVKALSRASCIGCSCAGSLEEYPVTGRLPTLLTLQGQVTGCLATTPPQCHQQLTARSH